MVKRRSSAKGNRAPFLLGAIAVGALLLFLGGELFAWVLSDSGRLAVWRHLHLGDRAHAVRIIGRRIEKGLQRAGVPSSAIESKPKAGDGPSLVWTVPLPRGTAPLLVNHLITTSVEAGGANVLSGRESPGAKGELTVILLVGVPGRPTHEVRLVRPARPEEGERHEAPKLALLLVASEEDDSLLVATCERSEMFSVGAPATGEGRSPALRAAHEKKREVVLFMPMEPENYPRVNPGPATLLVNMPAGRISQALRREIEVAAPVVAVGNLMGSFATQDEPFMTAIYDELRRSQLPFLHVNAVPRSVCRALASRVGAAYDEPDLVIDSEARSGNANSLDRAWAEALSHARERGASIVMLRITRKSAPWLSRALDPKKLGDVQLVPISAVIRRPPAAH